MAGERALCELAPVWGACITSGLGEPSSTHMLLHGMVFVAFRPLFFMCILFSLLVFHTLVLFPLSILCVYASPCVFHNNNKVYPSHRPPPQQRRRKRPAARTSKPATTAASSKPRTRASAVHVVSDDGHSGDDGMSADEMTFVRGRRQPAKAPTSPPPGMVVRTPGTKVRARGASVRVA